MQDFTSSDSINSTLNVWTKSLLEMMSRSIDRKFMGIADWQIINTDGIISDIGKLEEIYKLEELYVKYLKDPGSTHINREDEKEFFEKLINYRADHIKILNNLIFIYFWSFYENVILKKGIII